MMTTTRVITILIPTTRVTTILTTIIPKQYMKPIPYINQNHTPNMLLKLFTRRNMMIIILVIIILVAIINVMNTTQRMITIPTLQKMIITLITTQKMITTVTRRRSIQLKPFIPPNINHIQPILLIQQP